jgi:hypothetical protein
MVTFYQRLLASTNFSLFDGYVLHYTVIQITRGVFYVTI